MTSEEFEDRVEQLERRIAELADRLEAGGFIVRRGDLAAEAAAIADVLGVSVKTLRNWRNELCGPPAYLARGRSWYRLQEFLHWHDQATDARDGTVLASQPSSPDSAIVPSPSEPPER